MKTKFALAVCFVISSSAFSQSNSVIDGQIAFAITGVSFGYCAGKYGDPNGPGGSCLEKTRGFSQQMIPMFTAEAKKTCSNSPEPSRCLSREIGQMMSGIVQAYKKNGI